MVTDPRQIDAPRTEAGLTNREAMQTLFRRFFERSPKAGYSWAEFEADALTILEVAEAARPADSPDLTPAEEFAAEQLLDRPPMPSLDDLRRLAAPGMSLPMHVEVDNGPETWGVRLCISDGSTVARFGAAQKADAEYVAALLNAANPDPESVPVVVSGVPHRPRLSGDGPDVTDSGSPRPCCVIDPSHGHLAAAPQPRDATPADSLDAPVWFVERGQAEGFTPPVYYGSYAAPQLWTPDATKAVRFGSKADAEEWIAKFTAPLGIAARAVEHIFLRPADSLDALRARLREAIGTTDASEGLPHFHEADGKPGVFVDRQAVLDAIDAVLG